jgi:hypothetical protein
MGPFTSGTAREITNPEAEVERLAAARKPREQTLCEEGFPVDHDGAVFFVWVKVAAHHSPQAGEDMKPWPFPVRADLAARIADMIRADCAEA